MLRLSPCGSPTVAVVLFCSVCCVADGPTCERWCESPCADLNGNVEQECGACSTPKFKCRRGQPGFSWRERQAIPQVRKRPSTASKATVPRSNFRAASTTEVQSPFDEQHGCRPVVIEELAGGADAACIDWDPDMLPLELELGHRYCLHALCLGHMLSANGAAVEAHALVRAPERFMTHEYFPIRLGAAELFTSLCAQLSTTHLLEGAACIASAATRIESHDIAVRWMGIEAISRLLLLVNATATPAPEPAALAATSTAASGSTGLSQEPHPSSMLRVGRVGWGTDRGWYWDEYGSPGGSLRPVHASDEMESRLEHWQPGTRWMALHGVGLFADSSAAEEGAHEPPIELFDRVMLSLQDDMGFPGIGWLAMETLPQLVGRLTASNRTVEVVLTLLGNVLETQHARIGQRGTSVSLVRLLAIEAARRISTVAGPATASAASAAAFVERVAEGDPAVRIAAMLALGGMRTASASAIDAVQRIATSGSDEDPLVRCAARKALLSMQLSAKGSNRGLGHKVEMDANACGGDWELHKRTFLELSAGVPVEQPEAPSSEDVRGGVARTLLDPEEVLRRVAVAPATAHAAELCMHYLSSQPTDRPDAQSDAAAALARHPYLDGNRQRVRWLALLTLPLALPRSEHVDEHGRVEDDAAPLVHAHALRLLESDDQMDKYAGLKVLSMVAPVGDVKTSQALARTMRFWADVIKLQAGETLIALTPPSPSSGFDAAVEALVGELEHHDMYTRFAASVALRKLAASPHHCAASHVVAPQFSAHLLGQLHTSEPNALARVANTSRMLLRQCVATGAVNAKRAAMEEPAVDPRAVAAHPTQLGLIHVEVQPAGMVAAPPPEEDERTAERLSSASVDPGASSKLLSRPSADRVSSLRGIVGGAHCLARVRTLPDSTLDATIAAFVASKPRRCGDEQLSERSSMRRRGVLLMRGAIPLEQLQINRDYLHALMANSSGTTQAVKKYFGRATYRGGKMNSPRDINQINPGLLTTLDEMLRDFWQRGQAPPLPYAVYSREGEPQVREIEHVVLDPEQHGNCESSSHPSIPCGCDWHVDGGVRGYKLWAPVQKESVNLTNILLVQMSDAQAFCELAGELHAKASGVHALEDATEAMGEMQWNVHTDSKGASQEWVHEPRGEVHARLRDQAALESIGCPVYTQPGDVVIFFPGIFHRTQDVLSYRISIIADAS